MQINKSYLNRLVLIKYLFNLGVEQSKKAEPMCYYALLQFHDAIELFFQLAAEFLNINLKKVSSFMNYYSEINRKIAPKQLEMEESIRRLKNARKNFKHQGFSPSIRDIENYRIISTKFFEINTSKIFNMKFSEITLAGLVVNFEVKEKIALAERLLLQNEFKEVVEATAIAFKILLDDFLKDKRLFYQNSAFSIPHDLMMLEWNMEGLALGMSSYKISQMEKVKSVIYPLIDRINIIGIGIDYLKYAKFTSITPNVYLHNGKEWKCIERDDIQLKREDCQFCINFVIESALQIQKFQDF